jgi:hypothetical protein
VNLICTRSFLDLDAGRREREVVSDDDDFADLDARAGRSANPKRTESEHDTGDCRGGSSLPSIHAIHAHPLPY